MPGAREVVVGWRGELLGQSSCYYPSITQDPLEQFGISEEARFQLNGLKA